MYKDLKDINDKLVEIVERCTIKNDNLASVSFDKDLKVVYANEVFLDTIGLDLDDVIGKNILELKKIGLGDLKKPNKNYDRSKKLFKV